LIPITTVGGITIAGYGGSGGQYNNGDAASGGSYSGGDGGANGGAGGGTSGDQGVGSGGAIGGINGVSTPGSVGAIGANSADVSGLFVEVAAAGYSTTAGGGISAYCATGAADLNNGLNATRFGCGGGSSDYCGGYGGSGIFGGGAGGGSGYHSLVRTGGSGGS